MNFDKIKALCKKSKAIALYDTDDCQWLGDDCAVYPLYEHPEYNKDTIASVLSLDEKKKNEMHYILGEMPKYFNHCDTDDTEKPCGAFAFDISYMGESLMPLETSKGIRFIKSKYLLPLIKEEYEFYERQAPQGTIYIVIKVGFIVKAIIIPSDYVISATLIGELNRLADGAGETLTEFAEKL